MAEHIVCHSPFALCHVSGMGISAGGGDRTRTTLSRHRILSPDQRNFERGERVRVFVSFSREPAPFAFTEYHEKYERFDRDGDKKRTEKRNGTKNAAVKVRHIQKVPDCSLSLAYDPRSLRREPVLLPVYCDRHRTVFGAYQANRAIRRLKHQPWSSEPFNTPVA